MLEHARGRQQVRGISVTVHVGACKGQAAKAGRKLEGHLYLCMLEHARDRQQARGSKCEAVAGACVAGSSREVLAKQWAVGAVLGSCVGAWPSPSAVGAAVGEKNDSMLCAKVWPNSADVGAAVGENYSTLGAKVWLSGA
ncbi:hypothetical protein ACOSQ4_013620 [Xanthoceras sorbifolium]